MLRRLTARRSLCFLSPPGPFARNGLSLASNGCSLSKASIPGSTFPTCYFALLCKLSAARSACPLHTRFRFARTRLLLRERPVAASPLQIRAARPASTPPRGSYPPRDQRVSRPGCTLDRLLPWPDLPSLPIALLLLLDCPPIARKSRLRITVPGSLPLERLADSQTSWNLIYYAPVCFPRQSHFSFITSFFNRIYAFCFQMLTNIARAAVEDKTEPRVLCFAGYNDKSADLLSLHSRICAGWPFVRVRSEI